MESEICDYAYDDYMTTDPRDEDAIPSDWYECDRCGSIFNYEDEPLDYCPNCKYKGD